jgi:beta-glucosidase
MPDWFAEFTQAVMARIGDRVWSAAPVNEPWCVAWLSHFEGLHAPGLRDIRAAARAMHHVLLAHGRSIGVMRDLGIKNLGAVVNLEGATPASDTAEDHAAADRRDAIYNRAFLEPLFLGRYPEALLEGIAPHLPDGWQDDFDTIRAPVDWIGVNYYTRRRIAAAPGAWPGYAEAPPRGPCTGIGWEIHPEGLTDFLRRVARDYSGDLPILVTENGMAGDGLTDSARITYLAAHLQALRTAIAEGVPVTGYFVWSLMDNYEWALGYAARFGLVHVDFESLARHPKASYQALAHAWARDGLANGPKAP